MIEIMAYVTLLTTVEILSVNITRLGMTLVQEKSLKVALRININLIGKTSIWMWPIYGIMLPFLFVPLYDLLTMYDVNVVYRYLIYSPSATLIEALYGYVLWRFLGVRAWDYRNMSKIRITKYGFTTWPLLFLWGFGLIMLEDYADFLARIL